jgi:hypothetical protein
MERVREATVGIATVRLLKESGMFKGVVILKNRVEAREEGEDLDEVWRRLHDEAARLNPSFYGFDGARARFLHFFPQGFNTPTYFKQERDYKVQAKERLDANVPLENALNGSGYGEAILAIFRDTNLLYPVEKSRLTEALRGRNADQFVRGAARFSLGEIKAGLAEMRLALEPHQIAKWIAMTYLPFLWRPCIHMFLKPKVTKEFASRVGHRYANDYSSTLDPAVYESLLDLAVATAQAIADLEPRDNIDVQSFIWTVGEYVESDKQPN